MTTDAQKLLWIGCGELAGQTLPLLSHYAITGLSRRYKPYLAEHRFWQADLSAQNLSPPLGEQNFSVIIITLAPGAYTAEAYRSTYWLNTQYIVQQLGQNAKPLLVFVSSTSVYAQSDGEWVDESSPAAPVSPAAQWLLQAEQVIANSGCPFCILRPSGIYGPGRDYLIRQVLQGNGGSEQYTNRIHSLDLARLLAFVAEGYRKGEAVPPYLLASDDQPVSSQTLRQWLAQQLGVPSPIPSDEPPTRGGNKRISNRLLHQLGFKLRYPTYQEGYPELCQRAKLT
jgi:nucleoside-diphosphate-sugar epimerase